MSTFVPTTVTCPSCGVAFSAQVPRSINAHRTPAYRERILEGTFQQLPCPGCAAPVSAIGAFVYIDLGRKQLLGCFPLAELARWPMLAAEVRETYEVNLGPEGPPPARGLGEGCVVRATIGLTGLREKLLLFDAGLDDVVVEALKLELLEAGAAALDGVQVPHVLAAGPDGSLLIAVSETDAVEVDASAYHRRAAAGPQVPLAEALEAAGDFVDLRALLVPVR